VFFRGYSFQPLTFHHTPFTLFLALREIYSCLFGSIRGPFFVLFAPFRGYSEFPTVGLALVRHSFSDGGSEAALNAATLEILSIRKKTYMPARSFMLFYERFNNKDQVCHLVPESISLKPTDFTLERYARELRPSIRRPIPGLARSIRLPTVTPASNPCRDLLVWHLTNIP
jgi:hypothetical protein